MFNFIDFEASSLEDSKNYPIQVGWTIADKHKSFLIKPIDSWTDWCINAEYKIHKISREKIIKEGLEPKAVLLIMNEELSGQILYSDAHEKDNLWLTKLCEAAGIKATFEIQSLSQLSKRIFFDYDTFWYTRRMLVDHTKSHEAGYDAHINRKAFIQALNPIQHEKKQKKVKRHGERQKR